MDELYIFSLKKWIKCYIWVSIVVTKTGKYFYFYHLSKSRRASNLLDFDLKLPDIEKISYLVRKTKAYSKNDFWLDGRLAMFFVNKNLMK